MLGSMRSSPVGSAKSFANLFLERGFMRPHGVGDSLRVFVVDGGGVGLREEVQRYRSKSGESVAQMRKPQTLYDWVNCCVGVFRRIKVDNKVLVGFDQKTYGCCHLF